MRQKSLLHSVFCFRKHGLLLLLQLCLAVGVTADEDGFRKHVLPFFEANCTACHGPKKSKGNITLHTVGGKLEEGNLEDWELVLEMLGSGEWRELWGTEAVSVLGRHASPSSR